MKHRRGGEAGDEGLLGRRLWAMLLSTTYLVYLVVVGCLSFFRPDISDQWLTTFGRGNYWLFAPDPSSHYLHLTACWSPPRSAPGQLCKGRAVFASYDGRLEDALNPALAKPTRAYRLAEQLLELQSSDVAIDAFANRLMLISSHAAPREGCFRLIAHEALLNEPAAELRFHHRTLWKRCL